MRRLLVLVTLSVLIVGTPIAVVTSREDDSPPGQQRIAADDALDAIRSGSAPADCELPGGPSTIADANLGFAWRSFRSIDAAARANGDPSTTYSPYSAATAFHMLENGADPGTDQRLLAALCLRDMSVGELNGHAQSLRRSLERGDEVEVANAIWTSPRHTPTPRMDTIVRDQFDGEVGRFEFYEPGPLNDWISSRTKGRIPAMLEPENLNSDMVMLLANAITFDGKWVDRFEDARPGPFAAPNGEIEVDMLRDQRQLDYAFSEQDLDLVWAGDAELRKRAPAAFHAARIPYQGGRFAMVLVVPALDDGLDRVLASLGPDRWRALRESMEPTEVSLAMPKLKLTEQRDITRQLFDVGVPEGTYNRLVNEPESPITIFYVKQGTFLEVDERGTKAAAATVIGAGAVAGAAVVGMPVHADRPFLLAIEEVRTGEILFLSAVRDPRGVAG